MIKNVLIVDDDQEMLLSLKEGLKKYSETFTVLMAGDGVFAVEKLKENTISIVVTDLKMPLMDGFALLAHIMENYPDIPVIVMTAFSTPEMERLAQEGGAVGYIEKPFMVEDMARNIVTSLRKESEGGTLHGVSSGMFLQLIEMEEKTCTIRVSENATDNQGVLFFKKGELLNARVNGLQGEAAAHEIFSWDKVTLSIQNVCAQKNKIIQSSLQNILLEAMRLKDETSHPKKPAVVVEDEIEPDKLPEEDQLEKPNIINSVKNKLEKELGDNFGMEDIYQDNSWDELIAQSKRIGSFFNAAELKVCYVDKGQPVDFLLLPMKETTVISVNPKCPRDKIIQVLS